MVIQPGFGAPAHISPGEDKLFIVIQGKLKYLLGDKTEIAEPGARVQAAKGVIHGFTNVGEGEARHILVSTPRHHEEFFRNLQSISIRQDREPDLLTETATKNNQQIVGPLP
jgi:quercetin dioxygenase-like cupin family protein